MKPLFAHFRSKPAGLSLNPATGSPDEASLGEALGGVANGPPNPESSPSIDSEGRAPYATRLRVMLVLALLSWAIFGLIIWAALRF